MAKNKSEKCPYLSGYGGGYIRPDQWITEHMCSLIAKKHSRELPDRFWVLPEWATIFRRQVALAAGLLHFFKAEAVVAALRDKKLWNCYSFLGLCQISTFYKILNDNQNRLLVEESAAEIKLELSPTDAVPKRYTRNNILARLNKIDGQKKRSRPS